MFESLCTYPLRSDLFGFAVHPTAPVLALGLASGHVQLNCLPTSPSSSPPSSSSAFPPNSSPSASQPSVNTITTQWTTRRHKPSCRTLSFTLDGLHLVSAGTDGIVKLADTATGQVCSKIAVPASHKSSSSTIDQPTLIHTLSSQTLLLGTDSSAIHVYDVRSSSPSENSKISGPRIASKPAQTFHPHADYVTSTTSLPPAGTNSAQDAIQFLSTGGSTVAITDLRRGILEQSEDQGEELLASTLCGDRVAVGGEKGRLMIWQTGVWDDNEIEVDVTARAAAAIESMTTVPKEHWEDKESKVAVGMESGLVHFVELGMGRKGRSTKVLENELVRHDEMEGVVGLGFVDGGERMVTGGGAVVKIWDEKGEKYEDAEDVDELENEDEDDEDENEGVGSNGKKRKGTFDESNLGGTHDDDDDSDDDDHISKSSRKKKRKRGKKNGAAANQILRFKGLD